MLQQTIMFLHQHTTVTLLLNRYKIKILTVGILCFLKNHIIHKIHIIYLYQIYIRVTVGYIKFRTITLFMNFFQKLFINILYVSV